MGRITTVFFDVGMTLLKPVIEEGRVYSEEAAHRGVLVDPEQAEACIPQMYEYYNQLYEQDSTFWSDEERATATWIQLYEHLGSLLDVEASKRNAIARGVHQRYYNTVSWELFDDVIPALEQLKAQNMRMGLISNWDSTLEGVINGLGLAPYFDVVLASTVEQLNKPMAELFHRALERMGAYPEESMHVGDHLSADVEGSYAVGMTPVLIDRIGLKLSQAPPYAFSTTTLADLPGFLEQLGK